MDVDIPDIIILELDGTDEALNAPLLCVGDLILLVVVDPIPVSPFLVVNAFDPTNGLCNSPILDLEITCAGYGDLLTAF
jgi:hypothetical protein